MKYTRYFLYLVFFFKSIFIGCSYEFPSEPKNYSFGNADFVKFVIVGDEFSSGYMDGALYDEGQANSIPAIIAGQLLEVRKIYYNQPNINSMNGYNERASQNDQIKGRFVYSYSTRDTIFPSIESTLGELPTPYSGEKSLLNNFSVPGIKIFQTLDSRLVDNIYFARFALYPGESSVLSDAMFSEPTFLLLWLGNNDVLNYAMQGATGNNNPDQHPDQIGKTDLTPQEIFEQSFDEVMSYIEQNSNCQVLVINLPNFLFFPYFTAIPYNFLIVTNEERKYLTDFYRGFNEAIYLYNFGRPTEERRSFIDFPEDRLTHSIVIEDESLPDVFYSDGTPIPKIRQIEQNELVLLSIPRDRIRTPGLGTTIGVPDEYILQEMEISELEDRITSFNIIISNMVQKYSSMVTLIDMFSIVREFLFSRTVVDGVPLYPTMELNGAFSLDGVYFNQRGNAFLANKIVMHLNDRFDARIPYVDVNNFRGNYYTFY
jgi:hypothetical protein